MKTNHRLFFAIFGLLIVPAFATGAQPTVTLVAAGDNHTLFIKSDGSLWAMGDDAYGELGDGIYNGLGSSSPEQVPASGVKAMAVGSYHSLFLKSDGTLWAMGLNNEGQLGDGTRNSTASPERIAIGVSNVVAIAAGSNHSLFLKSDGTLWGMGDNDYGQLNLGPTGNFLTPQQLATGVKAIAAGGNHSLFLKKYGTLTEKTTELWAMGDNESGQLGDGTTNNPSSAEKILSYTELQLAPGAAVTAIATGTYHSLFIESDGSLWGMGRDDIGQLGDLTYNNKKSPEQIRASGVTAVAAGNYHTLFLQTDGSLWAMGEASEGQLGDNDSPDPIDGTYAYISINQPENIVASDVTAITAGGFDSLFIRSDGTLWGMGDETYDKLGIYLNLGYVYSPEFIVERPPPPLGITVYNNQPVVIYPVSTTAYYSLEMTTNVASGNWLPVPAGVPFNAVQFTNLPGTVFFRLQTIQRH